VAAAMPELTRKDEPPADAGTTTDDVLAFAY
jgi:hypothetical protein